MRSGPMTFCNCSGAIVSFAPVLTQDKYASYGKAMISKRFVCLIKMLRKRLMHLFRFGLRRMENQILLDAKHYPVAATRTRIAGGQRTRRGCAPDCSAPAPTRRATGRNADRSPTITGAGLAR